MGGYVRHATVPISEVVHLIRHQQGSEKALLSSGHRVGVISLRMRTFGRDAKPHIHCVACGLRATFFAVESFIGSSYPSEHVNLYGTVAGREILFTQDHIVPRSKGGSNALNNSQVMCQPCNSRKGHRDDNDFKAEMRGIQCP